MTDVTAATGRFPLEAFRILGSIGKGEFGKVHRATWLPSAPATSVAAAMSGVDVALKHIEAAQGGGKLQAEQDGVQYQKQVWERYPDMVPRVYVDGVAANGDYYIAMAFVRGESLLDILRRKRLTSAEAVRLATIVARFLQRLHDFQPPILHSDLKPEHVLVLDDGSVRIIDFGIARRPETGAATHNAFLSVMYAAPERVEDEARNVHPSDDLWALGIMFFEMLAGAHPREQYRARIEDAIRRDDLATVATLLREQPGTLPEGTSPQLDAIVRKMLAPQPGHRYASAAQLVADLDSFAAGRETVAWQQLVAAGRATRIVSRTATAAPGAPTMPVPRPRGEADKARPAVPPPLVVPPPLPRTFSGPRVEPDQARPTGAAAARPAIRRRFMTRRSAGVLLRALAALLLAFVMIAQVAAWTRVERYRRRVASLDLDDLSSIQPNLASLRRNAPLSFIVPMRLNRPVANRMLQLVEPTLADYRSDTPTAKLLQWKTTARALAIATDLEPRDTKIQSRARYVDGQLARIEAQGKSGAAARTTLTRAVTAFRDAARLDEAWPDPFIGLAAVHAYGFRDVEAVVADVSDAGRRGFTGGRREHAEVADAFSYRADQERAAAMRAQDDERQRLLQAAASDYEQCVANYSGVTGFFNSDRNVDRCQRLQDAVSRELAPVAAAGAGESGT
jgi:hypothetical protein